MTDSIFMLRCVDCDAQGRFSRLWLRNTIDVRRAGNAEELHYVECLNCGAHLKSRHRDRMEPVSDDEWRRCVSEQSRRSMTTAQGASRG
jgi:Zn ribbon nucleic-acid-binding protein